MMSGRRLPVAPRPYRDELLSSWLGRVACRYGLDAAGLVGALAADAEGEPRDIPIDDVAPPRTGILSWAQACGVDPARLMRLTLAWRRPERPKFWFSSGGPPWAPRFARSPPVCRACCEADRAAGRDEHLLADWMLAERCVCPAHRRFLLDCCPHCRARLHVGFRLRDGRARVICRECEQELAARSAREEDGALIEALISIQDRIGAIVRGAPARRGRLEEAVSMLWAPLDVPGAARPMLALWLDERGWRCPTEAQHAIGAPFPVGRLPIAWRVVTLIALDALFGIVRDGLCEPSSAAADLLRRAVLPQSRDGPRRRLSVPSPPRPFEEYLRLAREILLDPEWTTAAGAPPRRQEQILSRLMAGKLAASPPPGSARVSPPMKREASPPLKRENPTPGSDFSGLSAQ